MHRYFHGKKVKGSPFSEKIQFIQRYLKEHRLQVLLQAVELAKSSFYEFLNRKTSTQAEERKKRRKLVSAIFHENHGIYGARKIKKILEKSNVFATVRTISNDLKALTLVSCYVKKYRPKSKSSKEGYFINILKDKTPTKPLEYISTDITYIHTKKDGWVYQLTFLDLFTRKILLFDISKTMDSSFVNALLLRLLKLHPKIKCIHSDRGSQFTAHSYAEILVKYGVLASYSAKGYPYDNAKIESYHASLKIELIYRFKYNTLKDVYKAVFRYNYAFYNNKRIHQSLDYITPNEFEKLQKIA